MTIKIKIVFIVVACLLTSCTTPTKLGPYPTIKQDFQLPPTELISKYPSVEKRHSDLQTSRYVAIDYDQLLSDWGPPDSSEKRMWEMTSSMSPLVLLLSIEYGEFDSEVFGSLLLVSALVDYFFGPRIEQWQKGDYRILVRRTDNPFWDSKIAHWDWYYKNENESIVHSKWLKDRKIHSWFFEFNIHSGGDFVKADNEYIKLRYGNGGGLTLGYVFSLPFSRWEFDVSAAWDSTNFFSRYSGYTQERIYYDAIPMKLFSRNHWRAGVGISYTTNSYFTKNDYYANNIVTHKNTTGFISKLEYRQNVKHAFGMRLEFVGLERNDGTIDRADNIGFYLRSYF